MLGLIVLVVVVERDLGGVSIVYVPLVIVRWCLKELRCIHC